MYEILFTNRAEKDYYKIRKSQYWTKAKNLLTVLKNNPWQPPYEKLIDQEQTHSRRINIQHRLVYKIYEQEKAIEIISMWNHYDDN